MGLYGPIPKRADERRRRNKVDTTEVRMVGEVQVPPADEGWHKIAKDWYESLAESGQSKFYEPSDWATAYVVAESLSREMKSQFVGVNDDGPVFAKIPIKGGNLNAYLKAMQVLLVTEGDRRRLQLEIQRDREPRAEPAKVTRLDDYRAL